MDLVLGRLLCAMSVETVNHGVPRLAKIDSTSFSLSKVKFRARAVLSRPIPISCSIGLTKK